MAEVMKSSKTRKWTTKCKCGACIKYGAGDVYKKESKSPASILMSTKVNIDCIKCPDCGNEIQIYFQNETYE